MTSMHNEMKGWENGNGHLKCEISLNEASVYLTLRKKFPWLPEIGGSQ